MIRTLTDNTAPVAALATCLLLATGAPEERRIWRPHRNSALAILRACRRGDAGHDAALWLAAALWEIEASVREWEGNEEWESQNPK